MVARVYLHSTDSHVTNQYKSIVVSSVYSLLACFYLFTYFNWHLSLLLYNAWYLRLSCMWSFTESCHCSFGGISWRQKRHLACKTCCHNTDIVTGWMLLWSQRTRQPTQLHSFFSDLSWQSGGSSVSFVKNLEHCHPSVLWCCSLENMKWIHL